MKKLRIWLVLAVAPCLGAAAATSPIYENYGTVTNVPQVDATAFANYGYFGVSSTLPWETQNTRYFTNRGTMQASPGFRFEYVTSDGVRSPAEVFVNDVGGSIAGFDPSGTIIIGGGSYPITESSQVRVNAKRAVNRGILSVGASGLLGIQTDQGVFSRGGFEVQPIADAYAGFCIFGGSPFLTETNYTPDPGVYDLYWFATNAAMNVAGNLNLQVNTNTGLVDIDAPSHRVAEPVGGASSRCYFTNLTSFSLFNAAAFVRTNQVDPTNYIVQAAFVANVDPEVAVNARFYPSSTFTNPYSTIIVQLISPESNVVTGEVFDNNLYLMDRIASETNSLLLTNANTGPVCPTMLPGNYTLSRAQPCEFLLGRGPNTDVTTNLFFHTSYSNRVVTNFYAAYAAQVDNLITQLPAVPGVGVTNLGGRVEIEAENLDLTKARIRADGLISIKTDHLIGSAGAAIDCQNMIFDLASTNGPLLVKNMAKDQVQRYAGSLAVWSAVWTNLDGTVTTNMVEDPPGSGNMTNRATTNVITIGFHVTLVDGGMYTRQTAYVYEFAGRATNTVLSDNMNVQDSLQLNSDAFTIDTNASLSLGFNASDWNATSAAGVSYFTNNGFLSPYRDAWFGTDRSQPYQRFVNRGSVSASNVRIRSVELEESGTISAFDGPISVQTTAGKFEDSDYTSGGDLYLAGNNLKFDRHANTAVGTLFLQATNSLTDGGGSSSNVWSVGNGFQLTRKPAIGDLLGTSLQTEAPTFANVLHFWAAEDRGAAAAGFSNNVAIGRLLLNVGFDSALTFSGTGAANGMYVDYLELNGTLQSDLLNSLFIDTNLVIYFADANVPVEDLDGLYADAAKPDGRLRWVSSFAGPNSSVDVLLPDGRTIQVNRALRNSTTIDSDGDGFPNAQDPDPFDGLVVTQIAVLSQPVPGTVSITWHAAAAGVYAVEALSGVGAAEWTVLSVLTNGAAVAQPMTFLDTTAPTYSVHRFYRVRLIQ
jgi:hypothetical protein